MTQTTTGTIETGSGKLYYEMAGQGETLVLIHAGFVDSRMWDDQWAALAERYRVVRFDMRGFGRSDAATAPTPRRHDLLAVFDQLGIARATLIGCSLGGEVALDFALEQPERVSALILVSAVPGGFQLEGDPPPHVLDMIGAMQAGNLERAGDLQVCIWVDGMFRQPEAVDATVRARAREMCRIPLAQHTWPIVDMQPAQPLDPPAVERLETLDLPVLIIDGALDHPEVLRAGDVMAARIPNARKVVIPGGAHVVSMEQPGAFNASVESWLAAV